MVGRGKRRPRSSRKRPSGVSGGGVKKKKKRKTKKKTAAGPPKKKKRKTARRGAGRRGFATRYKDKYSDDFFNRVRTPR